VTGWDCHAHVFGPYAQFPLNAQRSYTPPEATVADYTTLLTNLGLEHGVLVQATAYGRDHSLLFHALRQSPQLRGVMVCQAHELVGLLAQQSQGVRAVRFSHRSGEGANFAGSATFTDLLEMAPALAKANLHAELWTDCKALPAIAKQLDTLPVPLVLDHMGGFDVNAGVDEPGFRSMLDLLARGKIWVKLCAYRNLFNAESIEQGLPFHQKLLEANPEQLVWGSDWPHLRVSPEPNTAELLALLKRWTPAPEKILLDNPAKLYR
jgi:predicted TIM-barrel fold metal-dependent hydrolase